MYLNLLSFYELICKTMMDALSFGPLYKTFTPLGLYLLLLSVAYTCFIFIFTTCICPRRICVVDTLLHPSTM